MFEQELRPMDISIPNEACWPVRTLNDLCSLISRGTAPVYVESSSVLAIGQRCVTSSRFAPEFARPHAERAMRNVLRPESGDVLLNSTGTGTIGRSVVFDHDGAFTVDGHVTVLRPKPEAADGRWLNSVLRTSWGQRHLERFCYAGSTNQLELSRTPVKASMLPVPSLAEQHAIAEILDTLDTAIRETEALIEKLKAVKQGLLHDLLTRGIDANGQLRPPKSEAPQLYKKSPLGWIPREWEIKPAESVCDAVIDCKNRTPPIMESGHPVIRTPNVRDGRFVYTELVFTDEESYKIWTQRGRPRPGDVLITREAPVGEVCLVPEDMHGACLGQRMMMYQPNPAFLRSDFMLIALLSQPVQRVLIDKAGGSTVGHVRVGDIRQLVVPVPSLPEQALIVDQYQAAVDRLGEEESTLVKLRNNKSGLMDELLTGRVRVTPLLESVQQTAVPTGA